MEAGKSGDNAGEGNAGWGNKITREVHKLESANHGEKKQWPSMTPEEKDLISRLHHLLGDRWELIARRLPTRTAQEVEIYWRTVKKRKFEETKIYKPLCTRLCRTRFNPTPKFTMDEALEKTKPSQTGS